MAILPVIHCLRLTLSLVVQVERLTSYQYILIDDFTILTISTMRRNCSRLEALQKNEYCLNGDDDVSVFSQAPADL